ncbi:MAG: AAA family ATPase [Acidobacteriia bacterium]|nr:AAA family ATPase [Terriglobia bacterium]
MQPSQSLSAESRAARTIRETFASGRPLTYIRTSEEQRVAALLGEVARAIFPPGAGEVWTWTLTEGMRAGNAPPVEGTREPRAALDFIAAFNASGIFHLKDFHEPLRDSPEARRRLRDVYDTCLDQRKFVVISSPVRFLVEEVERAMIFLDLRPPDPVELAGFVSEEAARVAPGAGLKYADLRQIASALQGLTLDEARYALRRAVAASPALGPECLPALLEEKRLLINRSGVIEFIPSGTSLDDIGGLENLKKWLLERRRLFDMRDSLSAEIVPKGILMMGIPGCGKSLSVKAIASCFQLPLYRVDMTEIFSGRHGNAEGAFVQSCRMMEDMAPAILWFDEIERGVTAKEVTGQQGRIFGFFLTWMQEKTRGLFVAATANRIDALPAEMIRKGRFDEVFFVDLPLERERVEIFRIHLSRRGVDPAHFNLENLIEFTNGWAGSEIEQCVVSALTAARLADRDMVEQDLISIAAKSVPLSRTMSEQINLIRGWAFERAVRASPNSAW